jgi:hypothetical protein
MYIDAQLWYREVNRFILVLEGKAWSPNCIDMLNNLHDSSVVDNSVPFF